MKLQIPFALLLLLAIVAFAGCYTQLGHRASSDFGRVHPKHYEGFSESGNRGRTCCRNRKNPN